jgi:DNA-binding CsgD family transcriptional regulator
MESYGLTSSELKVANFVRQGKRTREIASLLGISTRTVEAYRLGIRRKMRIQGRKVNLRTFLMSIN